MFKGGYKIVDLKNEPFVAGGEPVTIAGIYDAVEVSYEKPIMLAGLNVGGKAYGAAYVVPAISGTSYVITVHGYTITVQNTDAVTVVAA